MLRDGRPAYRELVGELSDRPRSAAEKLEDLPPCRIAERVERMSVSMHLP
jgi:hypothetical protein